MTEQLRLVLKRTLEWWCETCLAEDVSVGGRRVELYYGPLDRDHATQIAGEGDSTIPLAPERCARCGGSFQPQETTVDDLTNPNG